MAPPSSIAPVSFSAAAVDSGRLVVPMRAGYSVVRVAVEPATGAEAGWFWCLESDRQLTAAQHYCSSSGVRDLTTGYLASNGVVRIDEGLLVEGATFYVQLYCPDGCRWQAEVVPTPAPHSSVD